MTFQGTQFHGIPENIQLVCAALNSWRGDTDLQEFIWFCKQVTMHQEGKE